MAALEGIRIIDLSMGWAGPLASRHLADMGADVIKVESCVRFDWWRSWEATPQWIEDDGAEKSTAFNTVNHNKRNITLDLETNEGRALLLQLVATANAVVENYSGGVLPKLGLGYDVFRAAKPDIILLSMPAFGANGPWANFRAYGSTVEQSSGLPHLNGEARHQPTMQHVAYGDAVGGINGAAALLTALRHQAQTGEGQFVDLSQTEALFPLAISGILHYAAHRENPPRRGNRSDRYAPHNVYPCSGEDEWIVIQVFDEAQWQALQDAAGECLAGFGNSEDRLARNDALDEALADWTRGQDATGLMHRLQAAGVPAASTLRVSQLLDEPHLKARNFWQWKERAIVGNQPNPSAPWRINGKRVPVNTPAPTLGQHNEEVLGALPGVDDQTLRRLESKGIIGTKPRMRT